MHHNRSITCALLHRCHISAPLAQSSCLSRVFIRVKRV
jgi:hypothetical protein